MAALWAVFELDTVTTTELVARLGLPFSTTLRLLEDLTPHGLVKRTVASTNLWSIAETRYVETLSQAVGFEGGDLVPE